MVGDVEAGKTAYYALVKPHIRYGFIIWEGPSEANLNKSLMLQKRDSCREHYRTHLTVIELYVMAVVVYTDQLDFPGNMMLHPYNTRRAADYTLPYYKILQETIIHGKKNNKHLATKDKELLWRENEEAPAKME